MKRSALKRGAPMPRGKRLRPVGKRGLATRLALRKVRTLVLKRDRHLCQRCRSSLCKRLELHHRRGRAQCGTHTPENLVTLGRRCHELVTLRRAADWRRWVDVRKARGAS